MPTAGRSPDDVDMLFVRENTEGEYSGAGGRIHATFENAVAIESTIFTHKGCERIVRRAFELAEGREGVFDKRHEVQRVPLRIHLLG